MKQIIVLIFFLFLTFIDFANAFSCNRDFRFILAASKNKIKNTKHLTELDLKAQIEKLENYSEFFRGIKENDDIAIKMYYNAFLDRLDSHLNVGNFEIVKSMIQTIFRNVEFAYYFIKKGKPLSEKIASFSSHDRALPSSNLIELKFFSKKEMEFIQNEIGDFLNGEELLEKLNDLIIDQHVILAKNYFGYFYYRRHLEIILKDNGEKDLRLKEKIETILSSIGVKSVREKARFPAIFKGEKRPSLDSVENMISSNQFSNLIRLRIIRNFEIVRSIRSFFLQPKILNAIFTHVLHIPGMHSTRAVRLFRLIYDRQARVLYFPKIRQIVRSNMSIEDKTGLLKDLNLGTTANELLITFARRVDKRAEDTWKAIQGVAEKNDPDFAKQMDEAKTIAKQRGGISNIRRRSYVGILASLLVAGGTTSYFYMDERPVEASESVNPPGHSVTEIPVEEDGIEIENSTGSAGSSINLSDLEEVRFGVHIFDERFEKDLRLLENFALGQQGN